MIFLDTDPKRISALREAGFNVMNQSAPSALASPHYDVVIAINPEKFHERLQNEWPAFVDHGGQFFIVSV